MLIGGEWNRTTWMTCASLKAALLSGFIGTIWQPAQPSNEAATISKVELLKSHLFRSSLSLLGVDCVGQQIADRLVARAAINGRSGHAIADELVEVPCLQCGPEQQKRVPSRMRVIRGAVDLDEGLSGQDACHRRITSYVASVVLAVDRGEQRPGAWIEIGALLWREEGGHVGRGKLAPVVRVSDRRGSASHDGARQQGRATKHYWFHSRHTL